MVLSATLKRDAIDDVAVQYVDSFGGEHSFLAGPVLVKRSALPDPPPTLLRLEFSWYQAAKVAVAPGPEEGAAGQGKNAPGHEPSVLRQFAQGDRVRIVKNRNSGVRNPSEWLEQYLGRTGAVLWVTATGANVDLDGEAVWFSFDEFDPVG
jgi:hypothetical protein